MKRLALILTASIGIAAFSAGTPAAATAQLREVPVRFRTVLGGGATLLRPVGEFQNQVDWGGGLNLFGVWNPARSFPVGLRLDAAIMLYGYERFTVPPSPVLPRVRLEGTTSNWILTTGVGPQVTLGRGGFRPYGFATVGFAYYATSSELKGWDGGSFANTTNFDDASGAVSLGVGTLIHLSRGRHPALLDLSAVSVQGGTARYLRKGSLVDQPDGTVTFAPIESRTNNVQLRIGVAVGLR
jgi:hypothetical protein